MQNFLRKKMETLDDFLDQLQEEKEADDELKELQEKSSEREKQLCQLISIYSEQLHTIEEFLSDKEGWHEQFRMMSQKQKTGWLSDTNSGNRYCRGTIQLQIT